MTTAIYLRKKIYFFSKIVWKLTWGRMSPRKQRIVKTAHVANIIHSSYVLFCTSVCSTCNVWNPWRQVLFLTNLLSLIGSSADYTIVLSRCFWSICWIHNWNFHLRNYLVNGITICTLFYYYVSIQPSCCIALRGLIFLLFEFGWAFCNRMRK